MREYPAAELLVLDLSDLEFISRSFADQLVKEATVCLEVLKRLLALNHERYAEEQVAKGRR
jgi:anti-anti-sigma regulatory factor